MISNTFIYEQGLPLLASLAIIAMIFSFSKRVYKRFDRETLIPKVLFIIFILFMDTVGWRYINGFYEYNNWPIVFITLFGFLIAWFIIGLVSDIISVRLGEDGDMLISITKWLARIDVARMGLTFVWNICMYWPKSKEWLDPIKTVIEVSLAKYQFDFLNLFGPTVAYYAPIYFFTFLAVCLWLSGAAIYAIRQQITVMSAVMIWLQTILLSPMLFFRMLNSDTPFFDYVVGKTIHARLRTANSKTSQRASRGRKVNTGTGGDSRQEELEALDFAIKNSSVRVATANGMRRVSIRLKLDPSISTGQKIAKELDGFGRRINFESIVLQRNPNESEDGKSIFFNSEVPYNAGDQLGEFLTIFTDPFNLDKESVYYKDKRAYQVFGEIFRNLTRYLLHLSPVSISERITANLRRKYRINAASEANYPITQANLDLSVIPPARNAKRQTVEEATEEAIKLAESWKPDMARALSQIGLSGKFESLKVGGAVAMYSYVMPADSDMPTDKHAEKLANTLGINEQLQIVQKAGVMTVTRATNVLIPVPFTKMVESHPGNAKSIISGVIGLDAMNNPVIIELGDRNPHMMLFGKTGSGKTVAIMALLFSLMHYRSPKELQFVFIDGKGNSFQFMEKSPYTMYQPADGSGDLIYAQALMAEMEQEVRRRIELFKRAGVAKLAEYNSKGLKEPLPEIVVVFDEFSAITDRDDDRSLDSKERAQRNVTNKVEYIAKMARSVGIRLIMANQTARAEKVPGAIRANITGSVSLSVSAPIESNIAMPEAAEKAHLLTEPGDSYVMMDGINNIKRSQSPYIPQEQMDDLVEGEIRKFGPASYNKSREQVISIFDNDEERGTGSRPTNTRAKVDF